MEPLIAILTDFGMDDIYVGVMKGVIQRICNTARFIDITHDIHPQSVRQGAFALLNAYSYFTDGTIFLVVVDPGVGSTRRPIAVQAGTYTFVAPDNGILSYVLSETPMTLAVELKNPDYQLPAVSNTFHGRDIFSPAAAHLAAGVALDKLGPALDNLFRLPDPFLILNDETINGEVLQIDRFGNIITSIGQLSWIDQNHLSLYPRFGSAPPMISLVAENSSVTIADLKLVGIQNAYSETARGAFLALVGSNGYLEIAVNQGNAAERLDVQIGDRVSLHR